MNPFVGSFFVYPFFLIPMSLAVGQKAPAFTLQDQAGTEHSLKDYAGSWVLLYFYPKDDTPGCTKEACSFRDNLPKFKKVDAKVFGVSVDSVKSHAKFAEKFALLFTLLADTENTMVSDYGVWGKKKFMGREYMGTMRTSFLVDPKGNIAKIYKNVKPELHADEVLADLKEV
jgi:thioredoxin-dependent peroxiredoxin